MTFEWSAVHNPSVVGRTGGRASNCWLNSGGDAVMETARDCGAAVGDGGIDGARQVRAFVIYRTLSVVISRLTE